MNKPKGIDEYYKEAPQSEKIEFKPFSQRLLEQKIAECERLQKQLDRAKDALRKYTSKTALTYNDGTGYALRPYNDNGREAQKALDDIEELNKCEK